METQREPEGPRREAAEVAAEAGGLTAGEAAALKEELRAAQEALARAQQEHGRALSALRLRDAIRQGWRVHDAALVQGLIDVSSLKEAGDGFAGLDAQMRELKKQRPYLFEDEPAPRGGAPAAGAPLPGATGNEAVNAAIRAASGR